ncbi:MAG: isoprenyl transferase [Rikenellaceae bacterium]|nr:isoprenyl transferase [Rikenellaceae bacterium]MBP3613017.1 isoprenyl transferase [Rikenellaceae bacterium]MBP3683036.1 isoprenyl transferase [Rikenellaceae bacterium]
MSETRNIPQHVAIIMDGNGRWAKRRGKERVEGHIEGVQRLRDAIKASARWGVRYLTVYAFSTENWGRPEAEVNAIMELFCKSVINESPELQQQGVRVQVMGDRAGFSEKVLAYIDRIESETAAGERLTLVLAFNYSSRSELTKAVQQIATEVVEGRLAVDEIDSQTVADHLLSAGVPDPDLLIRTSGECRLSNFLLWQVAYSEFYFTEVLWPDFTEEEFDRAIESYMHRDRRFGLVKK